MPSFSCAAHVGGTGSPAACSLDARDATSGVGRTKPAELGVAWPEWSQAQIRLFGAPSLAGRPADHSYSACAENGWVGGGGLIQPRRGLCVPVTVGGLWDSRAYALSRLPRLAPCCRPRWSARGLGVTAPPLVSRPHSLRRQRPLTMGKRSCLSSKGPLPAVVLACLRQDGIALYQGKGGLYPPRIWSFVDQAAGHATELSPTFVQDRTRLCGRQRAGKAQAATRA